MGAPKSRWLSAGSKRSIGHDPPVSQNGLFVGSSPAQTRVGVSVRRPQGRRVDAPGAVVVLVTGVAELPQPASGQPLSADGWDSVVARREAEHVEQQTAVLGVGGAAGDGQSCLTDLVVGHS